MKVKKMEPLNLDAQSNKELETEILEVGDGLAVAKKHW